MNRQLARVRARLSYANVTATLALFIALGGTTYAAATLPRNSVGNAQLRPNSVTPSKIRSGSVGSSELHDRSVALRDISTSARNSLRGAQGVQGTAGPAGPAGPGVGDRAAVTLGGVKVAGNARGASHTTGNEYTVEFTHDVSGCIYSATLAAVNNGTTVEQPPAGGKATVASAGGANVLVKTYDAAAAAVEAPFHLMVSC
jgi:hypothetical protein